jgi:MraZ protein
MPTVPNSIDYIGEFDHRLDARNRVTVPSSWRVPGDEGNYYFAWPHPDGYIAIFPPEMQDELREKARAQRVSNPNAMKLLRVVFGRGNSFGCDKQGRIVLPPKLMLHAGIDKKVVLVGLGRHFEIWSDTRYAAQDEEFDMLTALQELDI